MTTYRVSTVKRPLEHVYVYPLVKPTPDQLDGDRDVLRLNWNAGSSWWRFHHESLLTNGDIWTPRMLGGKIVRYYGGPVVKSPSGFLDMAKGLANGHFGTKSPPFVYPYQRPAWEETWIWHTRTEQWCIGVKSNLKNGDIWWPRGDASDQMYGRPRSGPVPQ